MKISEIMSDVSILLNIDLLNKVKSTKNKITIQLLNGKNAQIKIYKKI